MLGKARKGTLQQAEEMARKVKAVFVLRQSPLVDPPLDAVCTGPVVVDHS